MRNVTTLLIFTFQFLFSQEKDYTIYHQLINKAEYSFFVKNDVDSSLYYYDSAFKTFDFLFVKDPINAAQIAKFSKKAHLKYLLKATEFGFKSTHLKNYPLLMDEDFNFSDKNEYEKNRKKYLDKINFNFLAYLNDLSIEDQKSKSFKNYDSIVFTTTNQLFDSIKKYGFPGEKYLGISDSTIFAEINKPELDLKNLVKNEKNLWYMIPNEGILAQENPIILLVHNACSFKLYENLLLEEIKRGNIHPRDVALIHDNFYRFINYFPSYCDTSFDHIYYLNNLYVEYPNNLNLEEVDRNRIKLNIVPMIVDEKKKEFEERYKFKLFSGFWNCR